jgi:tRNA nucleotidyltransferase (CCA-adding enzyme)
LSRIACEETVLNHIRPKSEEYEHIWSVAGRLIGAVNRSGIAQGMVVGSVARDTWVRGDRDLDVFLLFDPSLSRRDLEEKGLGLARDIAREFGENLKEKYAEHPYINVAIGDLDVDLVPCFAVETAAAIKSAVDRTPFHTKYICTHIKESTDDVLLLKQFMKGGGIYGSDHVTEGFAGYLCELLILHYGGFTPLLEAARNWRPGLIIDLIGHRAKDFEEPLVVVDPVDPRRNVASSLSLTKMSEFIELANGYLEQPSIDFFFPPKATRLEYEEYVDLVHARGTAIYALCIHTPPLVPDIIVPQLRKSLDAICGLLERHGFIIHRADCCMGEDSSMLLFEIAVDRLSAVQIHMGPTIFNRVHAQKFTSKYVDNCHAGPYIMNGRYYVEIERPYRRAEQLLGSAILLETSLGKHVKKAMQNGWKVLKGEDCWVEEFIPFLSSFFNKRSPLLRIFHQRAEEIE